MALQRIGVIPCSVFNGYFEIVFQPSSLDSLKVLDLKKQTLSFKQFFLIWRVLL